MRASITTLLHTSDVTVLGPIVVISSLTYVTHESSTRKSPEAFKQRASDTRNEQKYISHEFQEWKPNHVLHDVPAVFATVPAVHQPEFCKAGCIWTPSMPFCNWFAKLRWNPICTVRVLKQPVKTISESMSMCIYHIPDDLMWYVLRCTRCAVSWIAINGSQWSK